MVVVLLLAVGSLVRSCKKPATFPSVAAAVEELSAPENEANASAALAAIQFQGESALEPVRAFYEKAAPPPAAAAPEAPATESDPANPTTATSSAPSSPAEEKKAEQRAYAVLALTSLPATPRVVEAIVNTLAREPDVTLRENLANYLRQAAGFEAGVVGEDGIGDFGNDPAAWQRWWETDGRNRRSFTAPYGTKASTQPPES